MGKTGILHGHVQSIVAAIEDRDRQQSSTLLPNVNPAFSWMRLTQRIPVRVQLDEIPADFRMIVGRTATVSVRGAAPSFGAALALDAYTTVGRTTSCPTTRSPARRTRTAPSTARRMRPSRKARYPRSGGVCTTSGRRSTGERSARLQREPARGHRQSRPFARGSRKPSSRRSKAASRARRRRRSSERRNRRNSIC